MKSRLKIRLYILTTLTLLLGDFVIGFAFADTIIPGDIDTSLQVIKRLLITIDGSPTGNPIADLNSGGNIIFYPTIHDSNGNPYISSESDPMFSSSSAASISSSQISHWESAFGRGNHASMGYLTNESDPLWFLEKPNYYTKNDVDNLISSTIGGLKYKGVWDYSTGALPSDVSLGYFYKISAEGDYNGLHLLNGDMIIANEDVSGETNPDNWDVISNTVSEIDPVFSSSIVAGIESIDINHWNDAYSRGNHVLMGYLTGESDPIWILEKDNYYTKEQISSKGYLTGESDPQWNQDKSDYYTKNDINTKGYLTNFTESDPQWNSDKSSYYTKTIIDEKLNELSGNVGGISNESDPIWSVSSGDYYTKSEVNQKGFLTGFNESDPQWSADKSNYYTKSTIDQKGFITGYNENDPFWNSASGDYYTKTDIDAKGFLTSFNELDPLFSASVAAQITSTNISKWDSANDWIATNSGNSLYFYNNSGSYYTKSDIDNKGYLTNFDELDPEWNSASGDYYTKTDIDAKGFLTEQIWDQSGSSINYIRGNVGIGTTVPENKLDIIGYIDGDGASSELGWDIHPLDPPFGLSLELQSGDGLSIGKYYYYVTYYTNIGETNVNTRIDGVTSIITTDGNQRVLVSLPISDNPAVIGRKLYRGKVNNSYDVAYPLATIANNTTTSYIDSVPDSSLVGDNWSPYRSNTTSKFISVNGTRSLVVGSSLTTLGFNAGKSVTSAGSSVFVGSSAGYSTTYGFQNTAVGHISLYSNRTGGGNVAVGIGSLFSSINISNIVSIGSYSARYITAGNGGIFIGYNAGTSASTGGNLTSTADGVYLGRATIGTNGSSNEIVIGALANGIGSNSVVLGNDNITTTLLKGNIGIGTASPSEKLEVIGNIKISSTGSLLIGTDTINSERINNWDNVYSRGNHALMGYLTGFSELDPLWAIEKTNYYTKSDIDAKEFLTEQLWGLSGSDINYIGGNVGIGTINPQSKLHVDGTSGVPGTQNSLMTLRDSISNIGFQMGATTGRGWIRSADIGISNQTYGILNLGNNYVSLGDGSNEHQLYLNTINGNVGIGTTNPGVKLDVIGTHVSGIGMARFKGDAGNGFMSLDTTTGGEAGFLVSNAGTLIGQFGARASDNSVYIKNRIHGTNDIMTFSNGGNVGIGITSPVAKLHLLDSIKSDLLTLQSQVNPTLKIADSSVGGADFRLQATDTAGYIGMIGSKDFNFVVDFGGTNKGLFLKGTNGNIGIGTTTPSSKLDVSGDIELPTTGGVLLGEPNTEGTRRITTNAGALSFQVYKSGARVEKSTIAP